MVWPDMWVLKHLFVSQWPAAGSHPLKTLSGGECATNSVSMASSVPALGASSGASGLNVGFFSFTLLFCSESKGNSQG